jgi:MFS family permease
LIVNNSAIVALYNIGCLTGCIAAALFGNMLGRHRTIFVGCVIMAIGGVIQTATYGSTQLIIRRLISGLGNGGLTAVLERALLLFETIG